MKKTVTILVVTVSASLFTTVGIVATDYLTVTEGVCPSDMRAVDAVAGVLCVDKAEAKAASTCLHLAPDSPQATAGNIALPTCAAVGDGEVEPWRFVTREQAALLCARSNKRLPTAEEWYQIALATDVTSCVFADSVPSSEVASGCGTRAGVVHMPGNVWEWVSDDVRDGSYNGNKLPESGYVTQVDSAGLATLTSSTSDESFGLDYIRTSTTGVFGMVRGGYYGSGEDGGIYAVQANIAPTFASAGIGFRCVR